MTDDTKALVKRLNAAFRLSTHTALNGIDLGELFGCIQQAADTIERLERDRDALAERCEKLQAALATHVVAVDDWLNTFAPEHCAEARVKEAQDRIWESGGTLAYIAGLQAAARGALAEGCLAAPKDAP